MLPAWNPDLGLKELWSICPSMPETERQRHGIEIQETTGGNSNSFALAGAPLLSAPES